MAAELPCLVGDWDRNRTTVTHSVGLRIPTLLVEGLGEAEPASLLNETLRYGQAVGLLVQRVAIDIDPQALRPALLKLLNDPQRLAALGIAGRQRVTQHYSWPVVMKQWRQLLDRITQLRWQAHIKSKTISRLLPHWLPRWPRPTPPLTAQNCRATLQGHC